jgi:hypothetical protein
MAAGTARATPLAEKIAVSRVSIWIRYRAAATAGNQERGSFSARIGAVPFKPPAASGEGERKQVRGMRRSSRTECEKPS